MAHIIFGTQKAFQQKNPMLDIGMVFNFNSMYTGVPMLSRLNPFCGFTCNLNTSDPGFDQWYANYLSNDPNAFREFINFVRYAYNGINVWVFVDFSMEAMVNIVESLIFFISNMYGFACDECKEPEDTYFNTTPEFSPEGIQLFDAHMSNYLCCFGDRGLESDPE